MRWRRAAFADPGKGLKTPCWGAQASIAGAIGQRVDSIVNSEQVRAGGEVDLAQDVTLPAAAAAGLLSFLSPCVLPLVPPYLTYIAGTTLEDIAGTGSRRARRDVIAAAALFVAGFTTVFVGLGATASAFGQVLREHLAQLSALAGIAIILMGLHFLGVFRLALLYREARPQVQKPVGLWGAYVMGLAFAFGWTPCIGPILAAILAVAASEDTVGRGAWLLTVYSLGLGVPFLLAAVAIEPFIGFLKRFRAHFGKVERVVGALLVVTGIAFLTGSIQDVSFWLLQSFPGLARLEW
jgi:cytochrome c-type biogenesis protein